SGVRSDDNKTNDPTITGTVVDANGVSSFTGHLDSGTNEDLSGLVQPDGSFTLSKSVLDGLASGSLADGTHVLHLVAVDSAGNTTNLDVTFVLDTAVPVLTGALLSDTGVDSADGLTKVAAIIGSAADLNGIGTLTAGLDSAAPADYLNVKPKLSADGTFVIL